MPNPVGGVCRGAYFFSLSSTCLRPRSWPVRRAAMRPTFWPGTESRRTVDGWPMCWWLPPPWGCSTGFMATPRTYVASTREHASAPPPLNSEGSPTHARPLHAPGLRFSQPQPLRTFGHELRLALYLWKARPALSMGLSIRPPPDTMPIDARANDVIVFF